MLKSEGNWFCTAVSMLRSISPIWPVQLQVLPGVPSQVAGVGVPPTK